MELTFPHRVEYKTGRTPSIPDVIESLLAHEEIVQFLPILLEKALPGLSVSSVKISVSELKTGSLNEDYMVALFVSYQEELSTEIAGALSKMTGIEILQEYDKMVSLIIILLVLFGGIVAYKKLVGSDASTSTHIRGNYNRVLNITAEHLSLSSEMLDGLIADTAEEKPALLAKAAARFMRPAKKGEPQLIATGIPDVQIDAEAVREFPSTAEFMTEDAPPVPYLNVRLQVLALDRTQRNRGWAVRFLDGEVDGARLPMDIYPTVDLDALRKAEIIRADVLVEARTRTSGAPLSPRVHVVAVHEVVE